MMSNPAELFGLGNGTVIEGWFGAIRIGMTYFAETDVQLLAGFPERLIFCSGFTKRVVGD